MRLSDHSIDHYTNGTAAVMYIPTGSQDSQLCIIGAATHYLNEIIYFHTQPLSKERTYFWFNKMVETIKKGEELTLNYLCEDELQCTMSAIPLESGNVDSQMLTDIIAKDTVPAATKQVMQLFDTQVHYNRKQLLDVKG